MPIPKRIVDQVLERDGYRCVIAGEFCTGRATTADHRSNRGMGGSKVLNNPACLIASCETDNGLKEDADGPYRAELIRRGVRVEKAATNAQTLNRCLTKLVEYPDGRMYLLHQDFTRTEITEPPF